MSMSVNGSVPRSFNNTALLKPNFLDQPRRSVSREAMARKATFDMKIDLASTN